MCVPIQLNCGAAIFLALKVGVANDAHHNLLFFLSFLTLLSSSSPSSLIALAASCNNGPLLGSVCSSLGSDVGLLQDCLPLSGTAKSAASLIVWQTVFASRPDPFVRIPDTEPGNIVWPVVLSQSRSTLSLSPSRLSLPFNHLPVIRFIKVWPANRILPQKPTKTQRSPSAGITPHSLSFCLFLVSSSLLSSGEKLGIAVNVSVKSDRSPLVVPAIVCHLLSVCVSLDIEQLTARLRGECPGFLGV